MPLVSVICPKCSARIEVFPAQIGQHGRCDKCGSSIQFEAGQQPVSKAASPPAPEATATVSTPLPSSLPTPSESVSPAIEDGVAAVWTMGDVILDLYEVKEVFEGGGMGLVYRVHHKNWNIDLAVKSPRPEYFQNEQHKQNFEREAETWVNLGLHPHTVSCFYVRRLGGIPRIFAEYIEGGSLKDWIDSRKLYEGGPEKALERILDIAIQFAWGLHYAHEQGLIHQDVKPANVMMTPDGTAKVTDFGLAKARGVVGDVADQGGQKSILVSSGGMTPAYCSPEQAKGERLTRKTDIWSWAVSVLEMFTGDVTWPSGVVAAEAMESYLEMGTGTGDERVPKVPHDLIVLLRRCFELKPQMRPTTMLELVPALQLLYRQATSRAYSRPEPKPTEMLPDSLNNRAVSLLDIGKAQEAEQVWGQALAANRHHPQATYNLGLQRWRSGRQTDQELVRQLREVSSSHGDDWTGAYLLAQVQLERGDCEEAIRTIEVTGELAQTQQELARTLQLARDHLAASARCVRTFAGHMHFVTSVCLSGDGRWALSGSRDKMLMLWEAATGRCLQTFLGHTEYVTSVCLSGDGRSVLSGSKDATLKLWEVATGRCLRTFVGHTANVTSVWLSGDRWALSGSEDATLKLWEAATGRCLRTFQGHNRGVSSVCLSGDARWALSASWDKTLRLWEAATGRCLRTFEAHTEGVWSVCLSSDGRWALSGSRDKTLKLWAMSSGHCVRTFEGHTGEVISVCLSGDGRWALSGSGDKTLKLWEVATGRCLRTFEAHTEGVWSVCLSGDGRWALSGSSDYTLKIWQLAQLRRSGATELSRAAPAEIAASAKALAQAREKALAADYVGALEALHRARSQPGYIRAASLIELWSGLYLHLRRVGLLSGWEYAAFAGHTTGVTSVCLSSDGAWALSASHDKTLKLWEVPTGRCLRTFEGHYAEVSSANLSGDGRSALSGSSDYTLKLWEVSSGRCLRTFKGHTSEVTSVSLSSDGRWALSGSYHRARRRGLNWEVSSTLKFWEVDTGRCLRTFEGHTDTVYSVCLSSDGRWALSGSWDKTLKLWEVSTGRCLRTFEGHTASLWSVCLSGDGRWALSGSPDNTLKLWEVATGRCLRTFEGHTKTVTSVCLSGDGRWALSGSGDNTLKLWEVSTGHCLRTFEGHTNELTSVCLSGDGRWALSGSTASTLKLWFLDWELEARQPADGDERARPHLETFLSMHTPYAGVLPEGREPMDQEITIALTRRGKPTWTEEDFQRLLYTLGCAGYGWLRPEGVRRELEKMAANWQGPPPLV